MVKCQYGAAPGEIMGAARMFDLLSDFALFVCLAAWVSGMVIAIASLLG
jgi:hypothetical protein